MSESLNLSSLLSKPASEIEEPKLLPNGIYIGQITEYESRVVGEKKTNVIDFTIRILQPVDVEPSECELPKNLRYSQFITEQSLFYFRQFLESTLGIEGGSRTLADMLPEARGRSLRVEVVQQSYTPKGKTEARLINNINNVFPLED